MPTADERCSPRYIDQVPVMRFAVNGEIQRRVRFSCIDLPEKHLAMHTAGRSAFDQLGLSARSPIVSLHQEGDHQDRAQDMTGLDSDPRENGERDTQPVVGLTVLLKVFHADADSFRTAWFVELIVTRSSSSSSSGPGVRGGAGRIGC